MTPEELFNENMRLIWLVITKVRGTHTMDEDDLYQELAIVYWRCTQHFDESKGVKFSSYVVNSMLRQVKRAVFEHNCPMKITKKDGWEAYTDVQKRLGSIDDENFVEPVVQEHVDQKANAYEVLQKIVKRVPGKHGKILQDYLNGKQQTEIAREYGVTRSNIGQMLNAIFFRVFGKHRNELFKCITLRPLKDPSRKKRCKT